MVSYVWKYFQKGEKSTARCMVSTNGKICGSTLKCSGSSTKGLKDHLKAKHKIVDTNNHSQTASSEPTTSQAGNIRSASPEPSTSQAGNIQPTSALQIIPPPAKRQRTINECFQQQSYEEAIALEIVGGLNFEQVVNSKAVRFYFRTTFPTRNFPSSSTTVSEIMRDFYEKTAKVETIAFIQTHLKKLKFFSTTLDEWTSAAGRRYLNVNLHYFDDQNQPHKATNS